MDAPLDLKSYVQARAKKANLTGCCEELSAALGKSRALWEGLHSLCQDIESGNGNGGNAAAAGAGAAGAAAGAAAKSSKDGLRRRNGAVVNRI